MLADLLLSSIYHSTFRTNMPNASMLNKCKYVFIDNVVIMPCNLFINPRSLIRTPAFFITVLSGQKTTISFITYICPWSIRPWASCLFLAKLIFVTRSSIHKKCTLFEVTYFYIIIISIKVSLHYISLPKIYCNYIYIYIFTYNTCNNIGYQEWSTYYLYSINK